MLSRCQPQECRIGIPLGKTVEITGLHNQGQRRMRTNTQEANKLFHFFLITCFGSDLFNPLIVTLDFCFLFLVGCHVLVQCFPINRIKFHFLEPGNMLDRPFCSSILMTVAKDKRVDLLFQLLKRKLMIVPHPKILFDSIVFAGRDINRMVTAVAQALCDQTGITLIRFDPLSLRGKHGSRRKDNAFDPGPCKLVIKRISEAASLITAFNRIVVVETEFHLQRFNEANDFFVVRSNLYFSEDPVFCSDCGLHCT